MTEQKQEPITYPHNKEVAIASSLLPYPFDDERALYLSYRACGLSTAESLTIIFRSIEWLEHCREDVTFLQLEAKVPELRKQLSKEYVEIEFFRNFRMILEKDRRVIQESLSGKTMQVMLPDGSYDTVPAPMSRQDFDYLLKIRSQYTPQQIQILESVIKGESAGFDWSKFVAANQEEIQMSRTDTITLKRTTPNETSENS